MALAFESFSIREYAARMREVDTSKCWPFGGDGRDGQLPPIDCRKYRWWSSELQITRSTGASERSTDSAELACNVPEVAGAEEVGGGEPAVQQVDSALPVHEAPTGEEHEVGEEEGGQARSPGRAKTVRTPKKRSIVELFAVAPQIEAVGDEAADGDDDDAGGEGFDADGASKDDPIDDDVLHKDPVEESGKRKREPVEMPTRKKLKRNNLKKKKKKKKNKANEEKIKKKLRMKKRKKKQGLLNRQKRQKNNIKIGIDKKEKIRALSSQSPADFARLLCDSVIRTKFGKEIKVPVYAQRKKTANAESAPKQNKANAVQTSRLRKKLSEPKIFPIHSILKNQKGVNSSGLGNLQTTDGSLNGDQHHAQQQEKHVRFSEQDNVLVNGEKHCSPLGSPQMKSLCRVFSDVLAASAVVDISPEGNELLESNVAQVVAVNEDIVADCAANGKARQPLLSQQFSDVHDVAIPPMSSNQSNHSKEKRTLDDFVDLNNSLQTYSNLSQVDSCCPTEPFNHFSNDSLKVVNPCQLEGHYPQVVDDIGEIGLNRTDARRDLPLGSAAVIQPTMIRNSNSELTTSSLPVDMVVNKSQLYPMTKPHNDVYTCDSHFRSPCPPKKDATGTIFSSTGSMKHLCQKDMDLREMRQMENPTAIFHGKRTSGNIIGLPLNSHGEYVQLRSSSQLGFDQLFKQQNLVLGPVGSFLVHQSFEPNSMDHLNLNGRIPPTVHLDQKKWFSEKSYSRDQSVLIPVPGFPDISQTEVRNWESVEKYEQFVSNLNVEANLLRAPCHGLREQKQSHSHSDRDTVEVEGASEHGFQSITQPTLRLMGKNFPVSRSNKENPGSDDSKIWSDKRIISDPGPPLRMSEETITKRWPRPEWATLATSGTSYENLMHTLETQKKPGTSDFYHWAVDPRTDHAHLDRRQFVMAGNGCHAVSFSHGYKLDPFSHQHAPEEWLIKASMAKKNFESGSESVKLGLQSPQAVCNPENVCQHLLLSSTHCKHSQSLSHCMTSTFPPSPAFQNPEHGKYVEFPMAKCSSQSLPHWLLNEGQHSETLKSAPSPFPDSVPKHQLCTNSGTNYAPSPPLTSIMPFPSFGQKSHACFSDLPTPSSLVHSPLIPSFPAAKFSSTSNTCHWNMHNVRDGMKSKCSFPKSSDFANKTRKRPSVDGNKFLKPMKRPNVCMQGDSRAPMGSKIGEQLHSCTDHISNMVQLRDCGDRTVKVNDLKDAHVNAYAPGTSNLDTGSRSRPIKLSAGAKHILKPSMNMDHDNSMPTHSTIPFTSGISSGKVPVSQKKPAKIYQF